MTGPEDSIGGWKVLTGRAGVLKTGGARTCCSGGGVGSWIFSTFSGEKSFFFCGEEVSSSASEALV